MATSTVTVTADTRVSKWFSSLYSFWSDINLPIQRLLSSRQKDKKSKAKMIFNVLILCLASTISVLAKPRKFKNMFLKFYLFHVLENRIAFHWVSWFFFCSYFPWLIRRCVYIWISSVCLIAKQVAIISQNFYCDSFT